MARNYAAAAAAAAAAATEDFDAFNGALEAAMAGRARVPPTTTRATPTPTTTTTPTTPTLTTTTMSREAPMFHFDP